MTPNDVERSVDIEYLIDRLEHGCSVEEYYSLNHIIPEQKEALRKRLTEVVEQWCNDIGISIS